jgi:MscS family membrane protein
MKSVRKLLTQSGLLALGVALWISLVPPGAAQIPGLPKLGNSNTSTPVPQEAPKDPLGRSTPRGTMNGFIRAVNSNNFALAQDYMQLTASQTSNKEALARDLNELLDRYFTQRVSTISDSPDGAVDDGLPLDREQIGPLEIGAKEFAIGLVRVKNQDTGRIWLISADTLGQVPALHGSIEKTWLEQVMPQSLVNYKIFGISSAQIVVWAASIVIPYLLLWLISIVFIFLVRKVIHGPTSRALVDSWHARARWPLIVVLTLGSHLAAVSLLGFSLRARVIYSRVVVVLLIILCAWLVHRLVKLVFTSVPQKMKRWEQPSTRSLMLFAERVIQVLISLLAALLVLTVLGVDTNTVLAGLGLAGVALAIGARQTVENMLGGVSLLLDKAIAVGDFCKISDKLGVVEDITLRSVRLRTLEQSLLSIPASVLSQASIENFSTRKKILLRGTLRLRYGTSAAQLRSILDEIVKLLADNPKVETGTFRVRLIDFGLRAIELELYAYALTSAVPEFLAIQEEILLHVAEIVEAAGSGFARPEVQLHSESTPVTEKESPLIPPAAQEPKAIRSTNPT